MLWTPESLSQRAFYHDVSYAVEDLTTLTGTTLVTVWDPAASKKFVLKKFAVTAVVRTAFTLATNPRPLGFWDDDASAGSRLIADTGIVFQTAAVAGTWFTSGLRDLGAGIPSGAADRVLKIGFSGTIGAGVVSVQVWVAGEEK